MLENPEGSAPAVSDDVAVFTLLRKVLPQPRALGRIPAAPVGQ